MYRPVYVYEQGESPSCDKVLQEPYRLSENNKLHEKSCNPTGAAFFMSKYLLPKALSFFEIYHAHWRQSKRK